MKYLLLGLLLLVLNGCTWFTLADYNSINKGDTLAEVNQKLHHDGYHWGGFEDIEFYRWEQDFATVYVDFKNGKVYSKSQIGLDE